MNTGIYLIKNKYNNRIYVGSASKSFKTRFSGHINKLKINKHPNIHLQRSWIKYGESNFEFIILEYCNPQECINREQFYIDTLLPEYNISRIAGSRLGIKQGKDSPEKIAKRLEGMKRNDTPERIQVRKDHARKLGLSLKGKKMCEEHRKLAQNAAPKKPVIATNVKTGEKLEFISQMEASRNLNIDKRYISGILYGKFKTIKNWSFKWLT